MFDIWADKSIHLLLLKCSKVCLIMSFSSFNSIGQRLLLGNFGDCQSPESENPISRENRETFFQIGGCARSRKGIDVQCDQMAEQKVAQIYPKVVQKVATAVFAYLK